MSDQATDYSEYFKNYKKQDKRQVVTYTLNGRKLSDKATAIQYCFDTFNLGEFGFFGNNYDALVDRLRDRFSTHADTDVIIEISHADECVGTIKSIFESFNDDDETYKNVTVVKKS